MQENNQQPEDAEAVFARQKVMMDRENAMDKEMGELMMGPNEAEEAENKRKRQEIFANFAKNIEKRTAEIDKRNNKGNSRPTSSSKSNRGKKQ